MQPVYLKCRQSVSVVCVCTHALRDDSIYTDTETATVKIKKVKINGAWFHAHGYGNVSGYGNVYFDRTV